MVMAVGDVIEVNDTMQTSYRYKLAAPVGADFHEGFSPFYSPQKMLEMGVLKAPSMKKKSRGGLRVLLASHARVGAFRTSVLPLCASRPAKIKF
ncbi:MAG TPA: hypothetical protein VM487_15660 [Phycisphaerae bacterium]|nr:hypothetical protein [Phycisphaerae bacterium]